MRLIKSGTAKSISLATLETVIVPDIAQTKQDVLLFAQCHSLVL